MAVDNEFKPFREPLRKTLVRTGTIAAIAGAVVAWRWGGLRYWPLAALLMLWPAFGGHWVELTFLNVVRPRLPRSRGVQIIGRLAVWFVGGVILLFGMRLTAVAVSGYHLPRVFSWSLGGLAFVGVELIVHFVLFLRGCSNFYSDPARAIAL